MICVRAELFLPSEAEKGVMMIDKRVGKKAKRSVVLNKYAFTSNYYCTFVLKWKAGDNRTLDFTLPEGRGVHAGENGRESPVEQNESLVL